MYCNCNEGNNYLDGDTSCSECGADLSQIMNERFKHIQEKYPNIDIDTAYKLIDYMDEGQLEPDLLNKIYLINTNEEFTLEFDTKEDLEERFEEDYDFNFNGDTEVEDTIVIMNGLVYRNIKRVLSYTYEN